MDGFQLELGTAATDYHPNSVEVFVATDTATGNPHVLTADWSISGISSNYSPTAVAIRTLSNKITDHIYADGVLSVTTGETQIPIIVEAEACTVAVAGAGTFAIVSVTPPTTPPRGGSYRKLVPTTTGLYKLLFQVTAVTSKRVAIYALLRNPSAVTYTVSAFFNFFDGTFQETIIGDNTSSSAVQNYHLVDVVTLNQPLELIELHFTPSATSATGLDVDYVVIIPLENDDDRVIALRTFEFPPLQVDITLTVDPSELTAATPAVSAVGAFAQTIPPTGGDLYIISHGMTLTALPLIHKDNDWVYIEDSTSSLTPINVNITATRKLAFLTPQ